MCKSPAHCTIITDHQAALEPVVSDGSTAAAGLAPGLVDQAGRKAYSEQACWQAADWSCTASLIVLVLQGTQGSAFPLTGILGLAAVLYGLYQLRGNGGAYTVRACDSLKARAELLLLQARGGQQRPGHQRSLSRECKA